MGILELKKQHGQTCRHCDGRNPTALVCCRFIATEFTIHSLLEGTTRATGVVAVIDVLRAFSTAAVVLANGASSIVMVGTVEETLELRDRGHWPDLLRPSSPRMGDQSYV
jgi:hypothetical protein